ncbi:hypothetical protein LCGC14_1995700 [marine sediment metagenome]
MPIIACVGMASSCSSSKKPITNDSGMQKLNELITTNQFEILSDWAMPLATASMNSLANSGLLPPGSSASQINLIGNSNYVKIMGDSLSVYLPYFGERQMGGAYNTNGPGIGFEGIPERMEVTKNEDKQRYDILLKIDNDSENFTLNIGLYPNFKSTINVTSSKRFPIRYSGSVQAIEGEE